MKRYASLKHKARKVAARHGKSTKSIPYKPTAPLLKGEQKRLALFQSLDEKTKIKRILIVSTYGRNARRHLWKLVALSDGLTWQEYKELEILIRQERGAK